VKIELEEVEHSSEVSLSENFEYSGCLSPVD